MASYEPLGYVYFIQCKATSLIKIGVTQGSLEARIRGIQGMSPHPLEFNRLGVFKGRKLLERFLHGRFTHARSHGEWFRPAPDLLDFIERHAKPWPEPVSPWRGPKEDGEWVNEHEKVLDELVDWAWGEVIRNGRETPYHNIKTLARMFNAMSRNNGKPQFDIETGQLVHTGVPVVIAP